MSVAVEVDRVSRTFRRGRDVVTALREVSFVINQGEVVGLLGANGAGKTTITKIIGTMILPTSGMVRIFGTDVVAHPRVAREVTSVVLGGVRGLYGRLTGRENMEFFGTLGGLRWQDLRSRTRQALTEFGLDEVSSRPVETYSNGMRQRLHLAIGLITQPRLLLLDEPTVGLDPVEADRLRSVIGTVRNSGVTVLLTSHYLLDIERLADRVVLLADGQVANDMRVSQFRQLAGYAGAVTVSGTGTAPGRFAGHIDGLAVLGLETGPGTWKVRLRIANWDGDLFRELGELLNGIAVTDVEVAPVRLEDVYSRLLQTNAQISAGG